jgi:hypothetical protein
MAETDEPARYMFHLLTAKIHYCPPQLIDRNGDFF